MDTHSFKPKKTSNTKRPRAPIACYRCHHKKVRCDGVHPNCTRCLSTGVLCAYPSSRRSRNTQPTNVDPFIDNLSQLEARIRKIETDLESQRALVKTVCTNDDVLHSRILNTEKELNESRSIVAQLRLRGEQRVARGKRAAKNTVKKEAVVKPEMCFSNDLSWDLNNWTFQDANAFVDPMIIATAELPLLYEETSIMASRARGLPNNNVTNNALLIPALQPSSSSTSTASSSSYGFYNFNDLMQQHNL